MKYWGSLLKRSFKLCSHFLCVLDRSSGLWVNQLIETNSDDLTFSCLISTSHDATFGCLINKFFFKYVFTLCPFLRSWPYSKFSAAKYDSLKDQESRITGFGSTFVSHSSDFGLDWDVQIKTLIVTNLIQEQEINNSFPPSPLLMSGHQSAKLQYFV